MLHLVGTCFARRESSQSIASLPGLAPHPSRGESGEAGCHSSLLLAWQLNLGSFLLAHIKGCTGRRGLVLHGVTWVL